LPMPKTRLKTKEGADLASSQAQLSSTDVIHSLKHILDYAKPYQALVKRSEQAEHCGQMLTGLASNLERKSIEPIANLHAIPRRGLQRFVGENGWSHEPLVHQLRAEVAVEIGGDDAQVLLDGSAFPKKGTKTVGVKRQHCGTLGKVDNCVVGVFAAYVGRSEQAALVSGELFLPEEWCTDRDRREEAFVPKGVSYRTQPEIALDMLVELAGEMPFGWVGGDDEFGRTQALRDEARQLGKNYVFDVPCDTQVRTVDAHGRMRDRIWRADRLLRQRKESEWTYMVVNYGEKGPIKVRALALPVVTRREHGQWVSETLLFIEDANSQELWFCLANAPEGTPLEELVKRARLRHRIEEVFEECKGEVGLDHFEVRAWHGWYHHITLCQIAHWFLVRERRRLGKKSTRAHGEHAASGDRATAGAQAELRAISTRAQQDVESQRGGPAWALPREVHGAPAAASTPVSCYMHVAQ